jgi:hypothetical protein
LGKISCVSSFEISTIIEKGLHHSLLHTLCANQKLFSHQLLENGVNLPVATKTSNLLPTGIANEVKVFNFVSLSPILVVKKTKVSIKEPN